MRSRTQSQIGIQQPDSGPTIHRDPCAPGRVPAIEQRIPWWEGLAPATHAELELPAISALSGGVFDTVVIGGGVAGLSAAQSAREAGASVLVLERERRLGHGATGRNAGILSAGINMGIADLPPGGTEAAFWPETTKVLLSLAEEAARQGTLLSARLTGAISLAESKNAARYLVHEVRARQWAGLQAELWTAEQVAEATGGRLNTQSVVKAMWLPDEGRIHPLTLLAYLAKWARAEGVMIVGQADVTAYEEIKEEANEYRWKLTLANGLGIKARGLISAVGPTTRPSARIFALAFAADLPESFPLFWDASPYTYADFRPGNGRLTVSGGRYGRAGVTKHDAAYYKRLADKARHWLPELAGEEPIFTWAVDLDVAAEMIPALRVLGSNAPGVAIEGLGALGVLPGIVLGRRAGRSVVSRMG
jgi:glycine/D-amino acid oxidase-like deaminating enzyme